MFVDEPDRPFRIEASVAYCDLFIHRVEAAQRADDVRFGVTKPFATARPDSSNSLATAMSISPTPGVSASTGHLPLRSAIWSEGFQHNKLPAPVRCATRN